MRILLASAAAITAALSGCSQPAADTGEAAPAAARLAITKVALPGEGRGDYVLADSESRRLYVTHSGTVHILDLDTLKPLGAVEGLKKVHGVALAAGKGFASDGDGNAVVVFDPLTGKTSGTIAAGQNPDSILFDEPSGMIFAFNGASKDITVIDPATETVVKTIAVGDKPEFSRSDGQGKVYFNMEEEHAIGVIDTAKAALAGKLVLADCEGPAALGLDEGNRRLFSSCGNGVMKVVDADTGKIVASLPVGEDPDGIVYDPQTKRIFVAARDGAWTVIDQKGADRYVVNRQFRIPPYAKTLAFDPKTRRLFTSTADLVWPKQVPGKKLLPDAKPGSFRLLVISQN